MGVRATLTVSIIEQGRLWGLIACHHYQPHWLSQEIRAACDMLSEMISMQITLREYAFRAQATTHARAIQHDLIRRLAGNKYLFTALVDEETTLPGMLAADGVAISSDDTIVTYGITPELGDIRILVTWLQTTISAKVIVTDRLSTLSPTFTSMAGTASGMVVMEIDRDQGSYVFWFRREAVQTVTWGGNPAEKLLTTDGTSRLRPRKSFEAWQIEMRGISRPWPADSHMLVEALRTVLVEVVLELMTTRHTMVSLDLLRIRRAVEASSEPIVVADPEGTVLLVNPAFTRLTGYDTSALRLQGGLMTLPINTTLATGIEIAVRSQEGNWQGELEIRDRDGNAIPVQLRLDNVRNEAGASIGQIRLYTDLRPQRRVQEERRQLDAQLFETQKLESLGILAGGIAHDFNNLLTAMLGYANLVRLELPANSPALEGITQIELAAQRAAELSRQMLAYSGRGKFIVQPINLSHVVQEMVQLLQSVVTKTTILQINLNKQLPPVMADSTQIRQVVMNLITNAADAIGENGGQITLTTMAVTVDEAFFAPYTRFEPLPEGQYVLLEVADTGIGMDEQTQARVFEPFYTTKFIGRGLGLAAVQGIVRGHRGAIRMESQLGRGTTFGVLLPITTTSLKQSVREPAPMASGTGQLILVIDDDAGVRAFVQRALERTGYQTLMASDGQAGVATFASHMNQISAVLLDLTMPTMSGLETFNALRQIRADIQVILCSGYNEQEATHKFVGKGLAGFVQKPFRTHDLLEALHRIVASTSG
jgi:PAS domain S-box-containing protein